MGELDVQVVVEGGDGLLRALERMGVRVKDALEAAALVGAGLIASEADKLAPAPEVGTEVVERRKERVAVEVGPPDERWYWRFLETGAGRHEIPGPLAFEGREGPIVIGGADHPGMAAQPFLRPAYDRSHKAAAEAVGERLRWEMG